MAKKSSGGLTWGKIAGCMAFVALIITGINWIVGLIGGSLGILNTIAQILLVGTVFLSGWSFVCSTNLPGKRLYWQIAIILVAVLAACGAIGIGL